MNDPWVFGVPLTVPGTVVSDEPLSLTPEAQRELDERIEDQRRCRAAAMANAHRVVVWR